MSKKRSKRQKPITTEAELLKEVDVSKLSEIIKDPGAEERFVKLAHNMSPELLTEVLKVVPELTKVMVRFIDKRENVGKSLEETKRLRWQILQDLAKAEKLSPDQILEAMRIIAEIEKGENIDWTAAIEKAAKVTGVVFAIAAAVIGGVILDRHWSASKRT